MELNNSYEMHSYNKNGVNDYYAEFLEVSSLDKL